MQLKTDTFVMTWAIPDRVLLVTYTDGLNKQNLRQVTNGMQQFYEAGEKPVHVITDARGMESLDADLSTMQNALNVMRQDGWGWMMLIGTDNLKGFFARILAHSFGLDIRMADSPEEALASLRRLDQTLSE
jgi:hypothetical protein